MEEIEANRRAAETNSLDRYSCQQKGPGAIVFCQPVDRRPLSHASHSFAVLAPAPRPAPLLFLPKIPSRKYCRERRPYGTSPSPTINSIAKRNPAIFSRIAHFVNYQAYHLFLSDRAIITEQK
jgi:hypothetical protein